MLFKIFSAIILTYFSVYSLAESPVEQDPEKRHDYQTPTKRLEIKEYPQFADDLDFENIELAITRQIRRYNQKNLSGYVEMGGERIPQTQFRETLIHFLNVAKEYQNCLSKNLKQNEICKQRLNETIAKDFDVYAPELKKGDSGFGEDRFAWFTAYYTPTLLGQYTKSDEFAWGIYSKPEDRKLARSTREEIDFDGALENQGYDLFYSPDLFELYLLQVEGGGRVVINNEDGSQSSYYLSYEGTNGRTWNFISKYMREKGYINDGSVYSQRKFLEENPDKWREIYSTCPSYVYFKVTETPPLGNDSVPLTDNRSIATDRNYYRFKGLLSFVQTKRLKPDSREYDLPKPSPEAYMEFSRFMLDQDTGGAIRGKARVDLYFGEDEYAERAAQLVNNDGRLYFLVKKMD
ncbi:MAG: MltA domain-containing protein [Bdellovibrionales bacterium]